MAPVVFEIVAEQFMNVTPLKFASVVITPCIDGASTIHSADNREELYKKSREKLALLVRSRISTFQMLFFESASFTDAVILWVGKTVKF